MFNTLLQASSANPATANTWSSGIFLLAIVVLVTARLYKGSRGTRFSVSRIARLPAIYLLLTLFYIFYYNGSNLYMEITASVLLILIGLAAGFRYGGSTEFFDKENGVHYKRAPYVMVFWLAAYSGRVLLEMAFPALSLAQLAVNLLLAFSTGLLAGESTHIYRKYKEHLAAKAPNAH
jgi:hypothetical protein